MQFQHPFCLADQSPDLLWSEGYHFLVICTAETEEPTVEIQWWDNQALPSKPCDEGSRMSQPLSLVLDGDSGIEKMLIPSLPAIGSDDVQERMAAKPIS